MAVPSFLLLVSLILALSHFLVCAMPTVSAVGSKFFTSDGDQFFIKGIAYQLIAADPLIATEQCRLDASLMKELGANAIRVYHVDPHEDHKGCMQEFADAGIYLFVDLDSFETYIQLDDISWTKNKSDSYREVMDEFQKFDNTAGFFVGNEVLNGLEDSPAAPFLLAATADLRAYGDAKGYRPIPIGYSATDTEAFEGKLQNYLVCRPDPSEWLDFFSLNSYRWCGEKTFETSGYMQLGKDFKDYPIPLFFSEVGCNTVPPRDFENQEIIFGPEMTDIWSGAMIYEWIQELNHYGLISYGPMAGDEADDGSSVVQGFTRQGTPTPVLPDFTNLKSQWAKITPSGIASSAYTPGSTTPKPCPETEEGWAVDPRQLLPTLGAAVTAELTATADDASSTAQAIEKGTTSSAATATEAASAASESDSESNTAEESVDADPGLATSTTASDDAVQIHHSSLFLAVGTTPGCMLALLTGFLAAISLL